MNACDHKSAEPAHAGSATRLRAAGLRPTRQRLELGDLLFGKGDHHITAESLHAKALKAGVKVSLATVYNTLHQFTDAGLLREVVVDAARSYFDTNVSEHQHFYSEDDGILIDIPSQAITLSGMPTPPDGSAIERVDVVIRIKRK